MLIKENFVHFAGIHPLIHFNQNIQMVLTQFSMT
jgi:hypothetical protein